MLVVGLREVVIILQSRHIQYIHYSTVQIHLKNNNTIKNLTIECLLVFINYYLNADQARTRDESLVGHIHNFNWKAAASY